MKEFFFKRLIVYPLFFSLGVFYAYNNFPSVAEQIDGFKDMLPFGDSLTFQLLLFGMLLGYVYGTISTIIKVRSFKNIFLLAILFVLKVFFSAIIAVSFGLFVYIAEALIIAFILTYKFTNLKKNFHNKHKMKKNSTEEIQNPEALVHEMEKLIAQFKSQKTR